MTSKIGLQSTLVRKSDVLSSTIAEDLIILNEATGTFVGLDDIGHCIWKLLKTPLRVDEICDRLASCYIGDCEAINRDVMAFLTELYEEGLVRFVTP
ncbi:MAG: PqqD family protein [Stellaceae bacterium]